MKATSRFIAGGDGTPIFRYQWEPEDHPKALIHIAHGLAEHAGRYEPLARVLTRHGYAVSGHDHRGHGRTAGTPDRLGFVAADRGWETLVSDTRFLLETESRTRPGIPVILLGHSMGSFIAQQLMNECGDLLAGCALSGSTGRPRPIFRLLWGIAALDRIRLGPRERSHLLQRISLNNANRRFRPTRTDFDWLSRDRSEVDKYVADPFCGFVGTTQLWLDLFRGAFAVTRPEGRARVPRDLPVYVFSGLSDPVGEEGKGLERLLEAYRGAGLTRVRHRFYPEGRHEMLNEINRAQVVEELVQWLESLHGH